METNQGKIDASYAKYDVLWGLPNWYPPS
jgi:hypothetical protein